MIIRLYDIERKKANKEQQMITVDIELESDFSKERFQEIAEGIIGEFPYRCVDTQYELVPPVARDDNAHILIQLAQCDITNEQLAYLKDHGREVVREYKVREGGLKGRSLTPLQANVVYDLFNHSSLIDVADSDMTHKFFVNTGTDDYIVVTLNRYGGYTTIQYVNYSEVTRLILEESQVTGLLSSLLQVKLELEQKKLDAKPDDPDDHPF
jgi:hypothetical protein